MSRLLPALLAFALLTAPAAVRADIAPPDGCAGAEGAACNNAGPSYSAPGVCTTSTCSRTLPPAMPGGQPQTMQYDCKLCKPKAAADATSDTGKADGGGEKSDDGKCSYGHGRPGPLAALVGLGLVLAFTRGRKRP
jgi:hypothetical protein